MEFQWLRRAHTREPAGCDRIEIGFSLFFSIFLSLVQVRAPRERKFFFAIAINHQRIREGKKNQWRKRKTWYYARASDDYELLRCSLGSIEIAELKYFGDDLLHFQFVWLIFFFYLKQIKIN